MGSITSRPQIPAQSAPVIVTVPAASYPYAPPANDAAPPPAASAPATSAATGAIPAPATEPAANEDAVKSAARNAGLLDRRRGVLGTVLTGVRGLLNQGATAARKTLLGE